MTESESQVDLVPTKGLWNEYGVKETKFYAVLKELGIERLKQGTLRFIRAEDKRKLNQYFQSPHLFSSPREESRIVTKSLDESGDLSQQLSGLSLDQFLELAQAIALMLRPVDRFSHYEQLERFASHGWLISSKDLRSLIGQQLKGSVMWWGGFRLERVKTGWWSVVKEK